MEYDKVFGLLEFINKELEKRKNEWKNERRKESWSS
jgi:hypothetical protein